MPERQEIKRDFDLWWKDAGCTLAVQTLQYEAPLAKNLLLIAYTQGRLDECARITRQFQDRA